MTFSNTSSAVHIRWSIAAVAFFALTAPACSSDPDVDETEPSGPATVEGEADDAEADDGEAVDGTITIAGFDFGDPLTVDPGTVVEVVNDDGVAHTVTADDGSFDTGIVDAGASTELTLSESGTFSFVCSIHSAMTGTITVTG